MAVLILRPISDDFIQNCTQSEGTDYFALVNGASPYVTKYIMGVGAVNMCTFGFTAHGLVSGTIINSVKIYADVSNSSGIVKLYLGTGGESGNYNGWSGVTPTSFEVCSYEFTTNPLNDDLGWDVAGLDMIGSFGFDMQSGESPALCDQCYMEIDYTGGDPPPTPSTFIPWMEII